jgi:large subunit ribosomal protein L30
VSGRLRITLRRSQIGGTPRQREVLRGLGLRRINSSVVRPDDPAIRGMVYKVTHLVEVEEVAAAGESREPRAESREKGKTAGGRSHEAA